MTRSSALDIGGRYARIARAFSREYGVEVVFRGVGFKTDGKTIYLPQNVDYLGPEVEKLLDGFLDHEWCHVREENLHRARGETTPLERMKGMEPRVRDFMNAFEDARIERQASAVWDGVRENLERVRVYDNAEHIAKKAELAAKKNRDLWHETSVACVQAVQGSSVEWAHDSVRELVKGPLADVIARGRETGTAADTDALAREAHEIVTRCLDEARRDMEIIGPVILRGHDLSGFDAVAGGLSAGTDETLYPFALAEIESAARKDARTQRRYLPFPPAVAGDYVYSPPGHDGSLAEQWIRERAGRVSGALRARIGAVLRARSQRVVTPDRERGRIDSSALYSVRLGNRRVFQEPAPGIDDDVAVSNVVDLSGSMRSAARSRMFEAYLTRVDFAKIASWAIADTLAPINVPFEIVGFDNDSPHEPPAEESELWSRTYSFRFWRAKMFDDRWDRQSRKRLAAFDAGAQNVDGEALEFAARRLLSRPETRRILIVFSDGTPAGGCDEEHNETNLHAAIGRIARAGVQIIAVGVQNPSVEEFYGTGEYGPAVQGFNVEDLDGLAPAVLGALAQKFFRRNEDAA